MKLERPSTSKLVRILWLVAGLVVIAVLAYAISHVRTKRENGILVNA